MSASEKPPSEMEIFISSKLPLEREMLASEMQLLEKGKSSFCRQALGKGLFIVVIV